MGSLGTLGSLSISELLSEIMQTREKLFAI